MEAALSCRTMIERNFSNARAEYSANAVLPSYWPNTTSTPPKRIFGAGFFAKDNGVNFSEATSHGSMILLQNKPLVKEVDTF